MEDIDLHSEAANLVISNCTINHAKDKLQVWREINRILKRSGRFVVSDIYSLEEVPAEFFDPDAMHQAVLNLVTNAIDAVKADHVDDLNADSGSIESKPTGIVRMETGFHRTEGWHVDVIDNGPGVSPEDRIKVFSLFESKKGARGTGLGLPVSAKILKEHGGTIEILATLLPPGIRCPTMACPTSW